MKFKVEVDIVLGVEMEVEAEISADAISKVEMITDFSIGETDQDIVVTEIDLQNNDITNVEDMAKEKWNDMDAKERMDFLVDTCGVIASRAHELAGKDPCHIDEEYLEQLEVG